MTALGGFLQIRYCDGSVLELVNQCATRGRARATVPPGVCPADPSNEFASDADCDSECCCETWAGDVDENGFDLTRRRVCYAGASLGTAPYTTGSWVVDGVDRWGGDPDCGIPGVDLTAADLDEFAALLCRFDPHGTRWVVVAGSVCALVDETVADGYGPVDAGAGPVGAGVDFYAAWPHPSDPLNPAPWYDGTPESGEFYGFVLTAVEGSPFEAGSPIEADTGSGQRARTLARVREITLQATSVAGSTAGARVAAELFHRAFANTCGTCSGVEITVPVFCGTESAGDDDGLRTYRDVRVVSIERVTAEGTPSCAGDDWELVLQAGDPYAYRSPTLVCDTEFTEFDLAGPAADCVPWRRCEPAELEEYTTVEARCTLNIDVYADQTWCAVGWDPADYGDMWPPVDGDGNTCAVVVSTIPQTAGTVDPTATGSGCCPFEVEVLIDPDGTRWEPVGWVTADHTDTGGIPCDCDIVVSAILTRDATTDPWTYNTPPSGDRCCQYQIRSDGTLTPVPGEGQIAQPIDRVDRNGDLAILDAACSILILTDCPSDTPGSGDTVCTSGECTIRPIITPDTGGGQWFPLDFTHDRTADFPADDCDYRLETPDPDLSPTVTVTRTRRAATTAATRCDPPPGCGPTAPTLAPLDRISNCEWCEPLASWWWSCEIPPGPCFGDRVLTVEVTAGEIDAAYNRLVVWPLIEGRPGPDTPEGRAYYRTLVEPVAVAELVWQPAGSTRTFDGPAGSVTLDCGGGCCRTDRVGVTGANGGLWVPPEISSAVPLVVCAQVNPWAPVEAITVQVIERELA